MIQAHMATYPPRRAAMLQAVTRLAPQVDRLIVVLNEYEAVPEEFAVWPQVEPLLPEADLKDLGKFRPNAAEAEFVFLVDDDVIFPADFVATTLSAFRALDLPKALAGYHGSVYRRPGKDQPAYPKGDIAAHRRIIDFGDALDAPVIVDQIATNTAVMRARDFPPFDYMRGSECFVDVRLARWCFDNGVVPVCLPRPAGWLGAIRHDRTIYRDFTRRNPTHVADEIWHYAFQVPGRKTRLSTLGDGAALTEPAHQTSEKS